MITLENICKSYGDFVLFDHLNLEIGSGITSILGPSGSGKTQIIRMISGLSDPDSGNIVVDQKSRDQYGPIPMVFQAYSSFPWMTVLDNIILPLRMSGISKGNAIKMTESLIQICGLQEHTQKYAKIPELSGGQLQRVSIARALAQRNSKVLLLDEATGALDIKTKQEIDDLLLSIPGKTIINITHSIEEAVYLSDEIIILEPGPCRVKSRIKIELGHRSPDLKKTSLFINYINKIENLL